MTSNNEQLPCPRLCTNMPHAPSLLTLATSLSSRYLLLFPRLRELRHEGILLNSYQVVLKRPWCWERLKAGEEGDDRGWDGWMASPTRWTWVWASSGSGWWAGKPGVLQSTGSRSQTRLSNWTELSLSKSHLETALRGQVSRISLFLYMQTSLLNNHKMLSNWTWTFKWTWATTIPPNAHPLITSAVHAFIRHVSY